MPSRRRRRSKIMSLTMPLPNFSALVVLDVAGSIMGADFVLMDQAAGLHPFLSIAIFPKRRSPDSALSHPSQNLER
jgi:hypothetical protein